MRKPLDANDLSIQGLNLHAVFDLDKLPAELLDKLELSKEQKVHYSQLILIGHAGRKLWTELVRSMPAIEHSSNHELIDDEPIDHYSHGHVTQFFKQRFSDSDYKVIFPTLVDTPFKLDLQALGQLAGWHQPSPMAIGINPEWGTWFAYRSVVLVNSQFATNFIQSTNSLCNTCDTKDCVSNCPAKAVNTNGFNLNACITYRKLKHSKCQDKCIARLACPVSTQNQYCTSQVRYHYLHSFKLISKRYPKNS
jgi:hypothetical protein